MTEAGDWEREEERLASRSLAAGDPTGWFDQLYAAGATGRVQMPWSRAEPHPLLAGWAHERAVCGTGQRAVVVGCGLGADAEYVSGLGFDTVGFDVSGTAIQVARQRHPGSRVRYVRAGMLDPPEQWWRAFHLVVEIITVQALPNPPRRQAITNISRMVAPDGTLLVIAAVHDDHVPHSALPPWPLRRDEIEAFATDGLRPARIEILAAPGQPGEGR
jgi:SAM-dependent methyltransferase